MTNGIHQFTKQEAAICIVATQEGMTAPMLARILKNVAHCDEAIARKRELAKKVIAAMS